MSNPYSEIRKKYNAAVLADVEAYENLMAFQQTLIAQQIRLDAREEEAYQAHIAYKAMKAEEVFLRQSINNNLRQALPANKALPTHVVAMVHAIMQLEEQKQELTVAGIKLQEEAQKLRDHWKNAHEKEAKAFVQGLATLLTQTQQKAEKDLTPTQLAFKHKMQELFQTADGEPIALTEENQQLFTKSLTPISPDAIFKVNETLTSTYAEAPSADRKIFNHNMIQCNGIVCELRFARNTSTSKEKEEQEISSSQILAKIKLRKEIDNILKELDPSFLMKKVEMSGQMIEDSFSKMQGIAKNVRELADVTFAQNEKMQDLLAALGQAPDTAPRLRF